MPENIQRVGLGLRYLVAVALGLSFVGLVAIWFRLQEPKSDYDLARGQERLKKLETLREEARQKLNRYAVKDKEKGIVQIPVAHAMELVVADLKAKPVKRSEVAVESPYPYGLAPAPAAPAPAAPAAPAPAGSPAAQPTPGATPPEAGSSAATQEPAATPAPAPAPAPQGPADPSQGQPTSEGGKQP